MPILAEQIKLKNLRPGEKTIMVIKRHWIILIKLGAYFILGLFFTGMFYIFGNYAWAHLLVIIFWMMYSIFLYIEWINHELDLYIITNNRIIGVDQIGFLDRKVSECNLGQVQEVGNQSKGLLANLLNYGTITIKTAGSSTNFTMDIAPYPIVHSRKILNEVDKYRNSK